MIRAMLEGGRVFLSLDDSPVELALAIALITHCQKYCDVKGKVNLEKVKAELQAKLDKTEPPSFNN